MKYFLSLLLLTAVAFPLCAQESPTKTESPEAFGRITRKQKRELGILPVQVIPRAREMAKNGDITKDMTAREMAFCYAVEVSTSPEYGAAWKQVRDGTYGVDWDSIIELVTVIFELLIKFLPLFI